MAVKPVQKPDFVKYEGYIPKPIFQIMVLAEKIRKDKSLDKWIWKHTQSPGHYDAIMDALKLLSDPRFVEWLED